MSQPGKEPLGAGGLVGLGVQFIAPVIVLVFVGRWVDGKYAIAPWGVVAGAVLGFVIGFAAVVRAGRMGGKS
jgi:F0F1-type ATP synthase assembly protein I